MLGGYRFPNDRPPEVNLPLNSLIVRLKYIGPYLAERFETESYWPATSHRAADQRPMRTLHDLVDFVEQRRGNARKGVKAWLQRICENARGGACVDPPKMLQGVKRRYQAREVNEAGYNAVIMFLRARVNGRSLRNVPAHFRNRQLSSRYPEECATVEA
jgi:hypothetical protein